MPRTQKTEIVNMCMVRDGDRVLVLDKVHSRWGGLTFPGGHVERDESFTEAVVREVLEETGLTLDCPVLCGVKDWVNDDGSRYVVLFYKADRFSGRIKAGAEGNVFWMKLEDMLAAGDRLAVDMKDMIKVFLDDGLSEFFYYKEDGEWRYRLQ